MLTGLGYDALGYGTFLEIYNAHALALGIAVELEISIDYNAHALALGITVELEISVT